MKRPLPSLDNLPALYKRQRIMRMLKKRRRILPAGGLGVSPSFKKSPKIGGLGG
jgi:hypothetical protein